MSSYLLSVVWQFAVFGLMVIAAVTVYWLPKGLRAWLFSSAQGSSMVATLFSVVVGTAALTLLVVLFVFLMDQAFAPILLRTVTGTGSILSEPGQPAIHYLEPA